MSPAATKQSHGRPLRSSGNPVRRTRFGPPQEFIVAAEFRNTPRSGPYVPVTGTLRSSGMPRQRAELGLGDPVTHMSLSSILTIYNFYFLCLSSYWKYLLEIIAYWLYFININVYI